MYLLSVCHAQVIDCVAFCVTLYLFTFYRYGAKRKTARIFFSTIVHPLSIFKTCFCKIHHKSQCTSSFAYMYMYMYLLSVCHAQVIDCVAFCVTCICLLSTGLGQKRKAEGHLLHMYMYLPQFCTFLHACTTCW